MLVYTGPAEGDGHWQLWVHRWSSPDGMGRPIPNTGGVVDFDPSPENDAVVVVSDGALRVQSLESNAMRTLLPDGVHCCVGWSDDGWIYYTNAERGVSRVRAGGEEPEVLTTPSGSLTDRWAAPVAGTDLLVFERGQVLGIGSRIALLDPGSGETRDLVAGTSPVPFGDLVLFTSGGGGGGLSYVGVFDEERVVTTLASTIAWEWLAGRPSFDASSGGYLVYVASGSTATSSMGSPVWVERDGTETPVDPTLSMPLARVRLSPDGSHLLLAGFLGGGRASIHVKELPDGPLVLVRPMDELNIRPFWGSDGSAIYFTYGFVRDSVRLNEVRRARPDGTGEPEDVGLPGLDVMVTPDGKWWVYRTADYPDDPDLMAEPTDRASGPVPLAATDAYEGQPTVSRDGRWLAYYSDESGVGQVYVQAFPEAGSRRQITANGGASPMFSPGTDELFVVEDGRMVAYTYTAEPTFRVTGREPLFDASAYSLAGVSQTHDYDVTRDGRRFVMVRRLEPDGDASSTIVLLLDYLTTLEQEARR